MNKTYNHIVFFDGVCNLCNHTVDFLIRYNGAEDLHFSSLQLSFATQFLETYSIKTATLGIPKIDFQQLNTIYFYEVGKLYQKSEAVLNIVKHIK